jgi:CheY-like chemotaxis protein
MGMGKRILIIEDNAQNLYLVKYMLERAGHTVLSAADGAEGVRIADAELPDLILLDIQLPGMDGHAVARLLRSHPALDRTPIIAVTSYAMPGDREKAIAAGCDGYIEKPIDPERFVASVEAGMAIGRKGGGGDA